MNAIKSPFNFEIIITMDNYWNELIDNLSRFDYFFKINFLSYTEINLYGYNIL